MDKQEARRLDEDGYADGDAPVWVRVCGHHGCVMTAPHEHGTKREQDYARGLADGRARAEQFADVLTHTLAAPAGASPTYASAWRLGFADVRNRKYREQQAQAEEDDR